MLTADAAVTPGYCVDDACTCHRTGVAHPGYRFGGEGLPERCCNRCGRRGPKPLTLVSPPVETTLEEMAGRVERTRRLHGPLLQQFHEVWYNCEHSWAFTFFAGIGVMKSPNDMWAYQELMWMHRPKTVIETGTYHGGSALWYAFLMDLMNIEGGYVLTVDLDDHRRCQHPRIMFYGGDSTDPELVETIAANVNGPVLISLDSDHSAEHVRKELELYAPMAAVGDYVVVEDTNISWGDERGARGGVEDYLRAHPGEFRQDALCEKHLLTCSPGGWLQRIAPCRH